MLIISVSIVANAQAPDPEHLTVKITGCRDPSVNLEETDFICADGDYTPGNLGKTWNELDLVPHRLTTSLGTQETATEHYAIAIFAEAVAVDGFITPANCDTSTTIIPCLLIQSLRLPIVHVFWCRDACVSAKPRNATGLLNERKTPAKKASGLCWPSPNTDHWRVTMGSHRNGLL